MQKARTTTQTQRRSLALKLHAPSAKPETRARRAPRRIQRLRQSGTRETTAIRQCAQPMCRRANAPIAHRRRRRFAAPSAGRRGDYRCAKKAASESAETVAETERARRHRFALTPRTGELTHADGSSSWMKGWMEKRKVGRTRKKTRKWRRKKRQQRRQPAQRRDDAGEQIREHAVKWHCDVWHA
jgi:hypothetical protein